MHLSAKQVYDRLLYTLQQGQHAKLRELLSHSESGFLSFLSVSGPDATERGKIERKEGLAKVRAEIVDCALSVSKKLNINERVALELSQEVAKEQGFSSAGELERQVIIAFFGRREDRLGAISTIFFQRLNWYNSLSTEILGILDEYTRRLVERDIAKIALAHLKSCADYSQLHPDVYTYFVNERCNVTDLLCNIFSSYPLASCLPELIENIDAYSKSISVLSKSDSKKGKDEINREKKELNSLKRAASVLTVTFVASFRPESPERPSGTWVDQINNALSVKYWENKEASYWSVMCLAWGVFVDTKDSSSWINIAIDKGALVFLPTLLATLKALRSVIVPCEIFYSILDKLLTAILSSPHVNLLNMRRQEESQFKESPSGSDTRGPLHFLRKFITDLCEDYPTASLKFWEARNPATQFLRSSGDNLGNNQTLIAPFLHMLSAVSSGNPYAAFLFLVNHPAPVKLDYLCEVLQKYICEFRPQDSDHVYGRIGQLDLEILIAVIRFISKALRNKEALNMIVQNKSWAIFETLFGFLTCPVQTVLKAEVMKAISAFAETPEIVPIIWRQLEDTRMLDFTDTRTSGLRFELNNIMQQESEYNLLEAFLDLLEKLLLVGGIPETTSSFNKTIPNRPSGILPYIHFVLDDVLSRFEFRHYQAKTSKWYIGSRSLSILLLVLRNYEPTPEDFEHFHHQKTVKYSSDGSQNGKSSHPGVHIMQKMLCDDGECRGKLLRTAYAGCAEMLRKGKKPYYENLETTVKLVFELVELVIAKQKMFLYWNQKASAPGLFYPLERLLWRDKGDNIQNLIQPICTKGSPVAMTAVNILYHLSRVEDGQSHEQLVSVVLSMQDEVVRSLVDILSEPATASASNPTPETCLQLGVIRLLTDNLKAPSRIGYNLTHVLLGFNVQMPLEKTSLETAVTPLHAVLDKMVDDEMYEENPAFLVVLYELIYRLCETRTTAGPTFKLLKSQPNNFFLNQLKYLPVNFDSFADISMQDQLPYFSSLLQWRAWFLKTIALEIYCERDSRPNLKGILNALFTQQPVDDIQAYDNVSSLRNRSEGNRMILHSLLDVLDLKLPEPQQLPQLDEFTTDLVRNSNTRDCMIPNEYSFRIVDIKKLHKSLESTAAKLRFSGAGGPSSPANSIRAILTNLMEFNTYYNTFTSLCNFFKAWKSVLYVTLTCVFNTVREGERESILYSLLTQLLLKLSDQIKEPLQAHIASCIMLLMRKLREQKFQQHNHIQNSRQELTEGRYLPIKRLHEILHKLVGCIMMHGTSVETRGNLYAALLSYLQFTNKPFLHMTTTGNIRDAMQQEDDFQGKDMWFANEVHNQWVKLKEGNQSVLSAFGDKLVDIIAMDADASSVKLVQALSFSILDCLVRYDPSGRWMQSIVLHRGYLRKYMNDFMQNAFYQNALTQIQGYDIIIYETKLSFLLSMAETPNGAKCIIDNDVIPTLSTCDFIDQRPESTGDAEKWADIIERYHELLYPVLQLLAVCLNTLPDKPEAIDQVLDFFQAHGELFSVILRDRSPTITIQGLKQVEVLSRILYLLTPSWERAMFRLPQLKVFQSLMLNLLSKYSLQQQWLPLVKPVTDAELYANSQVIRGKKTMFMQMRDSEILKVWRNLISFCRVVSHGKPIRTNIDHWQILFTPSLSGALTATEGQRGRNVQTEDIPILIANRDHKPPSLATLIHLLRISVSRFDEVRKEQSEITTTINNISKLQEKDLLELLTKEQATLYSSQKGDYSSMQLQKLVQNKLSEEQLENSETKETLFYLIEHVLVLLLSHLSQFLRSLPSSSTPLGVSFDPPLLLPGMKKRDYIQQQALMVSEEQREELKRHANTLLGQTRLLDKLEKPTYRHNNTNTIETLSKKIRDLLKI